MAHLDHVMWMANNKMHQFDLEDAKAEFYRTLALAQALTGLTEEEIAQQLEERE